jgi:hypothetical protein
LFDYDRTFKRASDPAQVANWTEDVFKPISKLPVWILNDFTGATQVTKGGLGVSRNALKHRRSSFYT